MFAAALLATLAAAPWAAAQGTQSEPDAPRIELRDGVFRIERLPAGAAAADFSVRVEGAPGPMLGNVRVSAGRLEFRPRFPLEPGLRYRAELRSVPPLVAVFELPRPPAGAAPRVTQLYPTAERLPENLLKLYVQFSAPMSQGLAYAHIHVLDAAGARVQGAFVEIQPELWDPGGTRLTLLFDPGRIKRDLVPNRELGPPLRAGSRYTLVIDAAWPDPHGTPLAAEFRRGFEIGPADREPPAPARWTLQPPPAGSREPLRVSFGEPLDQALVQGALRVRGPGGAPLPGAGALRESETGWEFTPDAAWRPGAYQLGVDSILEDLAGNRPGRPFDVELAQPGAASPEPAAVSVPFEVR